LTSPTSTPVVKTVTVVITATPGTPTATPTPSAPTPTPGGPTPTPGGPTAAPGSANVTPAALPSATASTSQGVVTPLPQATPVPTVVGVQLGLVSYPAHEVASLQAAVDRGDPHYAFYLNPVEVVQYDLPAFGFTKGFQITSPGASPTPTPYTSTDGRPAVKVVVSYQGQTYTAITGQPATRGAKGIWLILSILQGAQ
jgi:hypothetical protein